MTDKESWWSGFRAALNLPDSVSRPQAMKIKETLIGCRSLMDQEAANFARAAIQKAGLITTPPAPEVPEVTPEMKALADYYLHAKQPTREEVEAESVTEEEMAPQVARMHERMAELRSTAPEPPPRYGADVSEPTNVLLDSIYRDVWSTIPHDRRLFDFGRRVWRAALSAQQAKGRVAK